MLQRLAAATILAGIVILAVILFAVCVFVGGITAVSAIILVTGGMFLSVVVWIGAVTLEWTMDQLAMLREHKAFKQISK